MKDLKIEVWTEKCLENKDDENVYFKLFEYENCIALCLVNNKGDKVPDGAILVLDSSFKAIIVNDRLTEKYPLKTDLMDSPIIVDYSEIRRLEELENRNAFGKIISHHMSQQEEHNNKSSKNTIN